MVVNWQELSWISELSRIWISRGFPWGCLYWKDLYNTIELGREWDVALGRLAGIIVNSDCRRYLQARFLRSGGGSPTARKMISRNNNYYKAKFRNDCSWRLLSRFWSVRMFWKAKMQLFRIFAWHKLHCSDLLVRLANAWGATKPPGGMFLVKHKHLIYIPWK